MHYRLSPLKLAVLVGALVPAGTAWALVAPPSLPLALGSGFALDGSNGAFVTYGPNLDSTSGSGINAAGNAYTNGASSLLVDGNPTVAVAGTGGAFAQAILYFYFQVSGPADTMVPVQVTGTVSATRPAGSLAELQAVISPANGDLLPIDPMLFVCFGTSDPACNRGSGTDTLTGTLSYEVAANVPQAVFMFATVNAQTDATGSFSAWADPTVRVDPGFAGAGSYQLSYSPGVTAAVPEPAAAALWLAGLGVAGLAAARRRRTPR